MTGKISATDQQSYREFCSDNQVYFFMQDWWLDFICGKNNWSASICRHKNQISGVMPFFLRKKVFFDLIRMPALTQFMGPFIAPLSSTSPVKILNHQFDTVSQLIKNLPQTDVFCQNLSFDINWLPFYREGFSQSSRYSYIIDTANGFDQIMKSMEGSVRTQLKTAVSENQLIESDDTSDLFRIMNLTYHRQNLNNPYSPFFLSELCQKCFSHGIGKLYYSISEKKNVSGAAFFVHDHRYLHYLMGGADPEFRSSGCQSLLVLQGIKDAVEKNLLFNFEGSMVSGIERFFRSFGGTPVPYSRVWKINSAALNLFDCTQRLFTKKGYWQE